MRQLVLPFLCCVAMALPLTVMAETLSCPVDVFADDDGDGVRDPGEAPLAGVAVSHLYDVRRTDDSGRVWFLHHTGRKVVLVKPPGWRVPARADGLPDIWRVMPAGTACGVQFGLVRDPRAAGELRVLLFADPQTRDGREVDWYGRGIVDAVIARQAADASPAGTPVVAVAGRIPDVDRAADAGRSPEVDRTADAGRRPADIGLTLGDITNDDPSLYPALNAHTTRLGVPWLHAPGNHDVDLAATTDDASLRSFAAVYGTDTVAWEEHEAVFVVLDDVIWQPGAVPKYIGGLREEQFRFLEQYLQGVDFQTRVVIVAHMPFFDDKPGVASFRPADRERLFALLQRFDQVLLLTAHGHVQRHHFHDPSTGWRGAGPLHEYNVGAACGSYWSGVAAADGIPVSTMADGTPKGWAAMTIRGHGDYSLRWHAAEAGTDPDTAIALHAPKVLRRGAWPGFGVYANIFMGVAGTRVEYRIDDGEWRPMAKVERPDPRVVAENLADDAADRLRAFDRLPEAVDSTHLWRGALPTTLAAGEHRIEVRAYDLWRGELTASTVYRLQDVPPR